MNPRKARSAIAVDLFCGAGGMSLGFERAGFTVVAAFDVDEHSIKAHALNFPATRTIRGDLSKLTGLEIRKLAKLGRRSIDVVFGGPPCQGFSIGGRRDVNDPRNKLIMEFARLVTELQPRYFVMENVAGLLQRQFKSVLKRFRKRLNESGYSIVEPVVSLNAAQFGVPQRRKRAFILGYRDQLRAPCYPTPINTSVTVGAAIDDLLCVEHARLIDGDRFVGRLGTPSSYAKELRKVTEGRGNALRGQRGLPGFARTEHAKEITKRFSAVRPGRVDLVSRFKRLSRTGLAPTLRAGTGLKNGRFMAPRPIHPDFHRCICVREAARLHSYPDWFSFDDTKWHAFMQIGNSVPPALATAVAERVMSALSARRARAR